MRPRCNMLGHTLPRSLQDVSNARMRLTGLHSEGINYATVRNLFEIDI